MLQNQKLCIVFLIHAESSIRDYIESVLHEHGALVFSASTARSALQFLKGYTDDVHLVIVDHHLPEAEGLEVAQAIARERPHCRVVLMTETPTDEGLEEWQGRLLRKPLHAGALRAQVEHALEAIPCEMSSPKARATEAT